MDIIRLIVASALAVIISLAVLPQVAGAADGDAMQQVQDRAAIQDLLVRYTIALDTLDADAYAGVFAEDAELTFGGNTHKGRDAIRKVIAGFKDSQKDRAADDPSRSYHAMSNNLIELLGDGRARHRAYWQTITGNAQGPFTVGIMGRYEDTLVKRNGVWLIQTRTVIQ